MTISGSVTDTNDSLPVVTVNGKKVWVSYGGQWDATVELKSGINTIIIIATNKLGKSTTETKMVSYGQAEIQQPVIQEPEKTVTTKYGPQVNTTNWPYFANTAEVTVSGTVTDPDSTGPFTLSINGVSDPVSASGSWSHTVSLMAGTNSFVLVATDADGITGQSTTSISYQP